MGTDCSVLRFFSIEANVKVYYRAEKGWTDVVSILVTEKMHYSLFSDLLLITIDSYQCWLLLFLACTYDKVVILFRLINIIDLRTLNVWYTKTTCQIDFKFTGSVVQVNRSLYTDFQAILKFYQNYCYF